MGRDAKEGGDAFGLQDADTADGLILPEVDAVDEGNAEISRFDIGVARLGVEALCDVAAGLEEVIWILKNLANATVDFMISERAVMTEAVANQGETLERTHEDGRERRLVLFFDLEYLFRGLERFVTGWITNLSEDQASDGGIFEAEFQVHGDGVERKVGRRKRKEIKNCSCDRFVYSKTS